MWHRSEATQRKSLCNVLLVQEGRKDVYCIEEAIGRRYISKRIKGFTSEEEDGEEEKGGIGAFSFT